MSIPPKLIALAIQGFTRLLFATLRFRIDDPHGFAESSGPRIVWLFWHNRLLTFPYMHNRFIKKRTGAALVSASKDGEILAQYLSMSGIHAIRGSSSRRGAVAILQMLELVEKGIDVAITPDGPRGPKYKLSPGPIIVAQKSGAKLFPVRVKYSRYWQLKSWDAFQIPKPFATVHMTFLPMETARATNSPEEFEQERQRIEAILREGQDD